MKDDQLEDTDFSPDVSDLSTGEDSTNVVTSNKMTNNENDTPSNGCEENWDFSEAISNKKPKVYPPHLKKLSTKRINIESLESPQGPSCWPPHTSSTPQPGTLVNRPTLVYQRTNGCGNTRGELKLVYDLSQIESHPNTFFNIPSELKNEVDEHVAFRRAKRRKELSQSSTSDFEDLCKKLNEAYKFIQKNAVEVENLMNNEEKPNLSKKELYETILNHYKKMNSLLESGIKDLKDGGSYFKNNDGLTNLPKNDEKNPKEKIIFESGDSKSVGSENDYLKSHLKTFFKKYSCILAITVDEKKHEITSVSVEQMNQVMDSQRETTNSGDLKHFKMSLSSGSLADHSSLSDSTSGNSLPKIPYPLPERHSSSSSSSSLNQNRPRLSHRFLMPSAVPEKAVLHERPKTCFCKCFCSLIKQHEVKYIQESLTTVHDLLNTSTENSISKNEINNTSKEVILTSKDTPEVLNSSKTKMPLLEEKIQDKLEHLNESSDSTVIMSESIEEDVKGKSHTKDLLVFGRWLNTYYPGKIEEMSEEDWNNADKPLKVIFMDGLWKNLANVFIIPATMLKAGANIMCSTESDMYEDGTLVSVEKTIDKNGQESLEFLVKTEDEIKTLPFDKIWFNELTKKQLGITPKKPQIWQVGTPCTVLKGRRQRRLSVMGKVSQLSLRDPFTLSKKKLKKTQSTLTVDDIPTASKLENLVKSDVSLKSLKRPSNVNKPEDDFPNNKKKKFIKKLEFEPKASTSSVVVQKIPEKVIHNQASETDFTLSDSFTDYAEVSDLDAEFIPPTIGTFKKSLEPGKIKSSIKTSNGADTVNSVVENNLGPIRKSTIFKGYNFILTHSEKNRLMSKSYCMKKKESIKSDISSTENEETDTTTDLEDHLENCPLFDYIRLKVQIKAGGGNFYNSIADINKNEYSQTIAISDYPCQTPNYLLCIALGIPIYRHDLIINCCKEDKPVSIMLKFSFYMPTGRSLENGNIIERIHLKSKKPLIGYLCAINLRFYKFWQHLLSAMGASVVSVNRSVVSESFNNLSFILGDAKKMSRHEYEIYRKESIPVVTKTWVIQTLIYGEPRQYLNFPEYSIFTNSSEAGDK